MGCRLGHRLLVSTALLLSPVALLRPISVDQVKPGDKVMLIGSTGLAGGMLARTLVIGASPIVGFGG